ncbi:methylated-DNA--[protein]-cysteine S-methyltransferase [Pseudobdellovibrio sp. HCB154]|uniref:methylated-DNA--[protein]-cysteine S-methyltransferase n=1 Tax=Pseudobdellovibrio sp. HCB154 TaxID=3386277 RepID=UPI0039175473
MTTTKVQRKIDSKVGPLFLVASEEALYGVFWKDQKLAKEQPGSRQEKLLAKAERQINEYLAGKRKTFDIPLKLEGTAFQKRVWAELLKIPYGTTKSYKEIAVSLKNPNACRAVGTANGRNPISLIVPCHRVINEGGKLGGYAGGLPIKKLLLTLEKR